VKVLQLVHAPQRRGAEVFARRLNAELTRQGHECSTTYLYPCQDGDALSPRAAEQVLGANPDHWLERTLGVNPVLLAKVLRAVDALGPDVVQVNGGRTVKYGALARRLRRQSRWALVYRNIGEPARWIRGRRRTLLYEMALRNCDGIIALSEGMLQQVDLFYSNTVPLRAVIPNGVDVDVLRPVRSAADMRQELATPQSGRVLLFVGSLSTEKRPDYVLRVFRNARREIPDTWLWVVGDGPLRSQFQARVEAEGLSSSVRMLGSRDDVGCIMAAADVVILLSVTEGVPAVLLEAGALGIPVLATRVGGIQECVCDGETGILVHPDDESATTAALTRLLTDSELRARLGENARRYIMRAFALPTVAAAYAEFYEHAVHLRRRGARPESTGPARRHA
jgi:glycosyltransferase involved in cell wall biosynthesis